MEARPLRLIDVATSVEKEAVVLHATADTDGGKYATLSHTWMAPVRHAVEEMATRTGAAASCPDGGVGYEDVVHSFTAQLMRSGAEGAEKSGTWDVTASHAAAKGVGVLLQVAAAVQLLGLRWLWADFVCINQADAAELRGEVVKMGAIYGGAALNVILPNGAGSSSMNGGSQAPRWFRRGWTMQEFLLAPCSVFMLFLRGPKKYRSPDGVEGRNTITPVEDMGEGVCILKHGQRCLPEQDKGAESQCLAHYDEGVPRPFRLHIAYNVAAGLMPRHEQACACLADPCERVVLVEAASIEAFIIKECSVGAFGTGSTKVYAHLLQDSFAVTRRLLADAHAAAHGGGDSTGGSARWSLLECFRMYWDREVMRPEDRMLCMLGIASLPPLPAPLAATAYGEAGLGALLAWALRCGAPEDVTAAMALDFAPATTGDCAFTSLPDHRGGEHVMPTAPFLGAAADGLSFRPSSVVHSSGGDVGKGSDGDDGGIEGAFETCEVSSLHVAWDDGGWTVPPESPIKASRALPYATDGGGPLAAFSTAWSAQGMPEGRIAGVVGSRCPRVEAHEIGRRLAATLVRLTLPSSSLAALLVCQRAVDGRRLAKVGLLFAKGEPPGLAWRAPEVVRIGGRPAAGGGTPFSV